MHRLSISLVPYARVVLLLALSPVAWAQAELSGQFDVASATQAFMDRLDADQRESSDAYFEGGYGLDVIELVYSLVLAWVLLRFRISVRIREKCESHSRFAFIQTATYVAVYTLLVFVITLPYIFYRTYVREHDYGLSNLSISDWFSEQLVGLGLEVVLSCIAVALVYWVIRKFPETWTYWGAIGCFVMLGLLVIVSPIYISPLFNDYQSLEDGPIRDRILSMARANGVPADDVYVFDASKQSKRVSANVSGLFGTTRISLNDNLLNRASVEGVEAVMAHEIGHYVLNHSLKLLIAFGLVIVFGFVILRWSFERVRQPAWGIRDIGDIAGLPLLIGIFSVYLYLMTPVLNSLVRINEVEADIFGLNAARQPDAFAETILSLSEYRKMNPGYWEEMIFFDHPGGYNRIHMAMTWKKENL